MFKWMVRAGDEDGLVSQSGPVGVSVWGQSGTGRPWSVLSRLHGGQQNLEATVKEIKPFLGLFTLLSYLALSPRLNQIASGGAVSHRPQPLMKPSAEWIWYGFSTLWLSLGLLNSIKCFNIASWVRSIEIRRSVMWAQRGESEHFASPISPPLSLSSSARPEYGMFFLQLVVYECTNGKKYHSGNVT